MIPWWYPLPLVLLLLVVIFAEPLWHLVHRKRKPEPEEWTPDPHAFSMNPPTSQRRSNAAAWLDVLTGREEAPWPPPDPNTPHLEYHYGSMYWHLGLHVGPHEYRSYFLDDRAPLVMALCNWVRDGRPAIWDADFGQDFTVTEGRFEVRPTSNRTGRLIIDDTLNDLWYES